MEIRKSILYPGAELTRKQNYKLYDIIEKDGSIIQRVFLDILDLRTREEVICRHYISKRIEFFYNEPVKFKVIGRDNPWDFTFEFNTGELFHVEITSIAEDPWIFEMLKREERIFLARHSKRITVREYLKVNSYFQGSESEDENIKGYSKDDVIDNPFFGMELCMTGQINDEKPKLSELIKDAIEKKQRK